jgi:hypothetical protein
LEKEKDLCLKNAWNIKVLKVNANLTILNQMDAESRIKYIKLMTIVLQSKKKISKEKLLKMDQLLHKWYHLQIFSHIALDHIIIQIMHKDIAVPI